MKPSERIKEIYKALQTLRGYEDEINSVADEAIMRFLDENAKGGTEKEINEAKITNFPKLLEGIFFIN